MWHLWCDYTFKSKLVLSPLKVEVKSTLMAWQVCKEPFKFQQTRRERGEERERKAQRERSFVFSIYSLLHQFPMWFIYFLICHEKSVSNRWALMSFTVYVKFFGPTVAKLHWSRFSFFFFFFFFQNTDSYTICHNDGNVTLFCKNQFFWLDVTF